MNARKLLGIRREDKNIWERRTPVIPEHLEELLTNDDIGALVQPSFRRIFPDADFAAAGAELGEDLDEADVVFAVKEIPVSLFRPGGAYVFFSHTIKGQPHNMPMLRRLLELGATLVDYEKITDDQGRRLVFFSRQAGQAGIIDTLHMLGQRLGQESIETPFADVQMAYEYGTLEAVRRGFAAVAAKLAADPLPGSIRPLVVGFAGYGNVSQGAQDVFDLLPHVTLTPESLLAGEAEKVTDAPLVKVVFREEHMVTKKGPGAFDLTEYYRHPDRYRGCFHRYLPHLHVLLNGIYWEPRYPRLVTCEALAELWSGSKAPRLRVLGDVSCDIEGSIECTVKATWPDDPAFVYDPVLGRAHDDEAGRGVVVMAVDNLPAELSLESSVHFSNSLRPYLAPLVQARRDVPLDSYAVPPPIRRAVIAYNGELTPGFSYLVDAL